MFNNPAGEIFSYRFFFIAFFGVAFLGWLRDWTAYQSSMLLVAFTVLVNSYLLLERQRWLVIADQRLEETLTNIDHRLRDLEHRFRE